MEKSQVPIDRKVAAQIAGRCGWKTSQTAISIIEKGLRPYIERCRAEANAKAGNIILPPGVRL